MSIVGADGRQISEGPTGREINIKEHVVKGSSRWGVEVNCEMDVLEALHVLSQVMQAIILTQRQKKVEKKVMNEVKKTMNDITKGLTDE